MRAAGRVTVPGDKSISHRYAMLAALAGGRSAIRGYSRGADCAATLACIGALGAQVHRSDPETVVITGVGRDGLRPPAAALDAANSGTTLRLLAGVVAGQAFTTTFTGDASLRRRPMRRIIDPLTRMGARIESADGRPPLIIHGATLTPIAHRPDVPSAQVKSCVLLAGLFADGVTAVEESTPTRDHTERALRTFSVTLETHHGRIAVRGGQRLEPCDLVVPGDISGAAFWAALVGGTPGGSVEVEGVGLNPTRTGLIEVLRRAGVRVAAEVADTGATEPAGRLLVSFDEARDFAIAPEDVPGVIDEIPALAALAAMVPGRTMTVRGAQELRVKESDRISSLAAGFRAMGADVDEFADGFQLRGRPLHGAVVDAAGDHRLAMAFAVAGTQASDPIHIVGAEAVDVSYPGFFETLSELTGVAHR